MLNNVALSGAGCGKSARPVLRRVWSEQSGHSTSPRDILGMVGAVALMQRSVIKDQCY